MPILQNADTGASKITFLILGTVELTNDSLTQYSGGWFVKIQHALSKRVYQTTVVLWLLKQM